MESQEPSDQVRKRRGGRGGEGDSSFAEEASMCVCVLVCVCVLGCL